MNNKCNSFYPPAGTAGGYFGFSSVTPPPRHILVCALRAAFRVKVYLGIIYTRIVYFGATPSVPSFIGSNVIFASLSVVTFLCVLQQLHLWMDFFQIWYEGISWYNLHAFCFLRCCPQCSVFYRVKGHILVDILVCTLSVALRDRFLSNFV